MTGRILEGPSLKFKVPKKSLGQLYFYNAAKYGNRVCQVDGNADVCETFASVKKRSTRVAIVLEKKGIKSKDVIAFCTSNTLDTIVPMLATYYLGAKVANLDPTLSVTHTRHLISLVSPKIVFVEENSLGLIEASLEEIDCQPEIIVYGSSTKYTTLSELMAPQDNEHAFTPSGVDLNEVALILFSSGTTGLPKAICHTHNSFMRIGSVMKDYEMGKTVLHFTSFYWITANIMLIVSFMTGANRLFFRSVDAEATFKMIEKYKGSSMFVAPSLINALTSFDGSVNFDTSSLNVIHFVGTPVSSSQYQKMSSVFPHSNIITVYGMTEVGVISGFHPELDRRFVKVKPSSCGTPLYGMKLKIVDVETERIVGPNHEGEIRVFSPCLMQGYYKTDSSNVFDEDGFLKTGDIGYYDKDGCLFYIDRIKEMFKYQSWHIVPSIIESALLLHPDVEEAVVFGVPCGEDGEAPGACVVLKTGAKVTEKEIEEFVGKNVADRERLRGGVWFVPNLSKTPTGKVSRKEIRDSVIKSE